MSRLTLTAAVFMLCHGALQAQPDAGRALPKTYGTNFQQVHVGAAAFRPASGSGYSFDYFASGYLYNVDATDVLVAPVTLPPGAEIHALCLYAFDNRTQDGLSVAISSARLVPGGLFPGLGSVGPPVQSSWDTGFGVVCADFAPPYTYSEAGAEDGVALTYHIFAFAPQGCALGGVKIIWRRQVSPPPASASFGDVPAGHGFFQFVEALVASGITAGCGGGNYCPDEPLTRGQMAVFLAKALGLHWPN